MEQYNTCNKNSRVGASKISLVATLLGFALFSGLAACSERDNTLRNTRVAQSEDRRLQSDNATTTQRNRESAQYDADNTGRNVRDRAESSRTASEQALSGSDTKVLADIRREITRNDDMSTNAKNIKIIVENGTVTLRGPVNSTNEKQWIERTTVAKAPNFQVVNELEVRDRS